MKNEQEPTPYRHIGKPLRRKEDHRLLTGQGEFSDDFNAPNQVYAAFVRSPYPHADIIRIDKSAALQLPGVLAVLDGADVLADGLNPIPHNPIPSTKNDIRLTGPDGGDIFIGPHLPLPTDKVRHVGEAVAMVVAETRHQVLDAVEAVDVTYRELPHEHDSRRALGARAPAVWDEVPGNVTVDTTFGDVAATDAAFTNATHVVRMEFHIDRVTGVPLEPRAALALPDAGGFTLYAGSGGAVRQKREMLSVLGLEARQLRVISKDVGGNFGTRNRVYVEFPLVLWAARRLGRPVKFTASRSEAFLSDYQGRDLATTVELALDGDGTFLALRADNISNVGARIVSLSPLGKGTALVTGPYHIPTASVRARAVFTNTMPTQAYRSSGRPEVTFALERLIDEAANRCGFDAVDLRRKNLIAASAMPYRNPIGALYDSGEYEKSMDIAMRMADWDGFAARQADAAGRGKLLGRGLANYVESSTGAPRERAVISIHPDKAIVDVVIGTQPSGQGHETSFAQVAAEYLGLPADQVNIVLGDTKRVHVGGGSHSGRSMRMAGTVIALAVEELIDKGRTAAAPLLDAVVEHIDFTDGLFRATESNRTIDLFDLAREVGPETLGVVRDNDFNDQVFPNGCHVCEIEVDPETGVPTITRHVAVDDVGRAINPLIVDGQTHGGIVQGVGQALWELCVTDPESGQPLAGSFMDYGMPRADAFPMFETALNEVPSPTNPLGIKAGGEGGTTPALAVITSAIVDALRPLGVSDIKMPATSHTIWKAIQAAKETNTP
ncbi:MAG: xanthine dehydrogenase family protein molybdopterin-binding subunit [Rhodospirillaceae bacterium]|nr:xanthine dehydrogenase family protein molybdopterin-binding subunit [Rhodospirillaceae bacterium]